MVRRLDISAPEFEADLSALGAGRSQTGAGVSAVVREILDDVRRRGDAAIGEYTLRFDGFDLAQVGMRVEAAEIKAAKAACAPDLLNALEHAARRIRAYHTKQIPADDFYTDEAGVGLGHQWRALSAVGIYVPGGRASYPSSVLMNVIPARVAGVERIAMTVPTPQGVLSPLVLAAAELAGVGEIYRIGGAQAIGALAFGTATIRPVDKIVGPGNVYVAEAKKQVFGVVGIDLIAGPSEILVVADARNNPAWIAADLMSQAEHDPLAQATLITDDPAFATKVETAVESLLADLATSAVARASWEANGTIILVPRLDQAVDLIDRIAPEHLELAIENPRAFATRVRNAGAIFLGRFTPEAVGDYIGGPNHVLPTSGSARFSSGLGVLDFMTRTSLLECSPESLGRIGPDGARLAAAEGLPAHKLSLTARHEKDS